MNIGYTIVLNSKRIFCFFEMVDFLQRGSTIAETLKPVLGFIFHSTN